MKCISFLVILFAWHASLSSQESPAYSSHAVFVYERGSASSPDRIKTVTVHRVGEDAPDTEMIVRSEGTTLRARVRFGLNAEVLWSSDSKAFAITGSSEGANGQYQTDVFYVDSGRLRRVPLTLLLERAFGHPVRCGWPEVPNVVAVEWIEPSRTLLLATQIIHHSNCDSYGSFAGFVVDLERMRLVRRLNQIALKRQFGVDLGPELRNTNDSCILQPKSCYVPANHPELNLPPR
jgi:hypothetical protein